MATEEQTAEEERSEFARDIIERASRECGGIREEVTAALERIADLQSSFAEPYRVLRALGEDIEPIQGTAAFNATMSIALEERDKRIADLETELEGARNGVQATVAGSELSQARIRELERANSDLRGVNTTQRKEIEAATALATELQERTEENARLKSELESARKVGKEGGPKTPGPSQPERPAESLDTATTSNRKGAEPAVTEAQAREFVQTLDGPFSGATVAEHFGVASSTAGRLLKKLARRGTIARPNGSPTTGRGAKWEFVKPTGGGPRRRPRSEPSPSRGGGAPAPVPGTGKPNGPAERPGKLKRQQAKAAPVRHKPVKGVRV